MFPEQTAIAAMHHMTELTVQFLVSLIPHERVEILKAMHVNGVVDILGAMDLQVALNLCWELSSDHLAEISLRMEVHLLVKVCCDIGYKTTDQRLLSTR